MQLSRLARGAFYLLAIRGYNKGNHFMRYADISFVYLLDHLAGRGRDFLKHWYVDGFLRSVDWTLHIFERLDRRIALRITAKNWFQPLYQDYTIIGFIWGFIFRTIRIFVGLIVYAAVLTAAILLFLLWSAFPLLAVYQIFKNL